MSDQPSPSSPTDTHGGGPLFPILERMDFLNHAGVAPISPAAAEALRVYARQASEQVYIGSGWYRRAKEVKASAAKLINAAGPHEIAFIPNTSTGLAQVANGLPLSEGDRVVITSVEYPANRYPWEHLARTRGIELHEVPQQPDGRIDVEDVINAITDRTRVVAISHVQYASGFRIDLKRISAVTRQVPGTCYLCVDAIQSVGVVPVDVRALGIDFLAADGHKWMLGPEGCGIFYCREDLAPILTPTVVGWMCMENAGDFGNYEYALLPDARRFEPGSWNIPGIVALGASLDLLLEVGAEAVWSRVEALTARLCEGLKEKGYRVFSPRREAAERSGIVVFEPSDGKPAAPRIVDDLGRKNIILVTREGRLRASPHYYNTVEQIDRLLDALP